MHSAELALRRIGRVAPAVAVAALKRLRDPGEGGICLLGAGACRLLGPAELVLGQHVPVDGEFRDVVPPEVSAPARRGPALRVCQPSSISFSGAGAWSAIARTTARGAGALLPHADRALEWIERYGDADGDGFVEYHRATEQGLANQGWKDSWDAITFADGRIARSPIALAEVQGYTYAAYAARAHFAREQGDRDGARHWAGKAKALKRAFNEKFWLPDRGWYALGLDADKRPIDSLASNIGHCLWTGIVDDDKAPSVAAQLLSPEMFSGWGIRTLATSMGAYNPMSYHNGSVWPHDNALCAAGLMRYGFVDHAQRVAVAILDAATHFQHRLPELFCGFPREMFAEPVPYPTSCSPQAWAAATPLHLLRTLLRFDPQVPTGRLWCDPAIPSRYLPLRISRQPGQGPPHGRRDLRRRPAPGTRTPWRPAVRRAAAGTRQPRP